MGIINVTPDSFSQDGQYQSSINIRSIVKFARRMVRDGADMLDIGGESSRPGARRVSASQEMDRVIPVIEALSREVSVPISVDTYKASVARAAIRAGAEIVNNIKGCQLTDSMIRVVRETGAGIILMHMRGNPRNMQKQLEYVDVIDEITGLLRKSIENCLESGIKSDRIIIDPGIGFGKSVEHNLTIINRLADFQKLKCPMVMGTSRKSFIGKVLDVDVDQRLYGTLASLSACVMRGAHIVRVHDVAAARQVCDLTDAIINEKEIKHV